MQPWDTVEKCPLPWASCGSFKKFPCLNFVPSAWQTNEFTAKVTEGVVHAVYKVVTLSSFGVAWQHEVSGGKWTFHHCVTRLHINPRW